MGSDMAGQGVVEPFEVIEIRGRLDPRLLEKPVDIDQFVERANIARLLQCHRAGRQFFDITRFDLEAGVRHDHGFPRLAGIDQGEGKVF
jgi:hypothetical protein